MTSLTDRTTGVAVQHEPVPVDPRGWLRWAGGEVDVRLRPGESTQLTGRIPVP